MNKSLLNKPGVYVFWRDCERIYVGSSANLAKRPAKRDRGHASRWQAILVATRTELIPCESLVKARQLEERIITEHRPIYNLRTPHAQADIERTTQIIRDNW